MKMTGSLVSTLAHQNTNEAAADSEVPEDEMGLWQNAVSKGLWNSTVYIYHFTLPVLLAYALMWV